MQTVGEIGKKTQINADTLSKMSDSNKLKAKMCEEFDKSYDTIQRWINGNDIMLTTIDSLKIIHAVLDITMENAIEYINN